MSGAGNLARMTTGRPAIVHVNESVGDDLTTVTVTLDWDDEAYTGKASGSSLVEERPRLVGEATLRAVEAVTDGRLHMELAAIATTVLGSTRVAMAQIRIAQTDQVLVGNALIDEDDASLASVKAVMDAINRPLGRML